MTVKSIQIGATLKKVILARSGAHMIDDIAFKYESSLSRC